MGFKTNKHGDVYKEKSSKGHSGNSPGNNDGSNETTRSDGYTTKIIGGPELFTHSKKSHKMHQELKLNHYLDELESKGQETPEQTYNRIEPIIDELNKTEIFENNSLASGYLNDLLNDLEEPNAEPDEYDDGAKFDNFNADLEFMKEALNDTN